MKKSRISFMGFICTTMFLTSCGSTGGGSGQCNHSYKYRICESDPSKHELYCDKCNHVSSTEEHKFHDDTVAYITNVAVKIPGKENGWEYYTYCSDCGAEKLVVEEFVPKVSERRMTWDYIPIEKCDSTRTYIKNGVKKTITYKTYTNRNNSNETLKEFSNKISSKEDEYKTFETLIVKDDKDNFMEGWFYNNHQLLSINENDNELYYFAEYPYGYIDKTEKYEPCFYKGLDENGNRVDYTYTDLIYDAQNHCYILENAYFVELNRKEQFKSYGFIPKEIDKIKPGEVSGVEAVYKGTYKLYFSDDYLCAYEFESDDKTFQSEYKLDRIGYIQEDLDGLANYISKFDVVGDKVNISDLKYATPEAGIYDMDIDATTWNRDWHAGHKPTHIKAYLDVYNDMMYVNRCNITFDDDVTLSYAIMSGGTIAVPTNNGKHEWLYATSAYNPAAEYGFDFSTFRNTFLPYGSSNTKNFEFDEQLRKYVQTDDEYSPYDSNYKIYNCEFNLLNGHLSKANYKVILTVQGRGTTLNANISQSFTPGYLDSTQCDEIFGIIS